jgi:hypothetical protein
MLYVEPLQCEIIPEVEEIFFQYLKIIISFNEKLSYIIDEQMKFQ